MANSTDADSLNTNTFRTTSQLETVSKLETTQEELVSIVIPVLNEEENVDGMYASLCQSMEKQSRPFELIFVDDGSSDTTYQKLCEISEADHRTRLVRFRRNYGQTAAMQAGIDHAHGNVVVTIDGDRQNDPDDIPAMLDKIDEGYDLVHGWRKDRKDAWLSRKLPSRLANRLISKTTGFPIHDLGCTLKAIRIDIAEELELYGEMHRFIPILAHQRGARCFEMVTRHHPRTAGTTKYGIGRTTRVLLDLITVKYMLDYFASPMKLFGKIGLWLIGLSLASCVVSAAMKVFFAIDVTGNPFTLIAMLFGAASIQFFSLGLLGEVNARIYFGSQGKRHYAVRECVNLEGRQRPTTKLDVSKAA